ncbi:phage tail sheath subtilisin-like domain-containing protein [Methanobacterium sp.]|uniref:phage tail sheath subtilisin-like domain-containing protein n=1 Tax=Methanobacterium sp. TaxID=2164 RepID=UPI003C7284C5
MAIDTTIPRTSAKIIPTGSDAPVGSAGIIAVVGRFEKGDSGKPYYITGPNDGLNKMGDSPNYPGSKILELIFKKDMDNNNYGAPAAIAIKAGASVGAECTLVDTTATPVDVMTLSVPGGEWGNDLTATVTTGTLSGKKLVIKKGTEVIDSFDNCANAEALYNKIRSASVLNIQVTAHDLTKTLKDVADSPFTGGTEIADPTATDLNDALTVLNDEDFDIIIFTDMPDDSSYATIEAYLNDRLENDKFTMSILPIDSSKTVTQVKTIVAGVDTGLIQFITQSITVNDEELNDAETAARIAGFTAGLPVNKSLTNKIISDITALSRTFTKGDSSSETYVLTDTGVMVLELKSRKNNSYGVVSAVTASHELGDDGKKTVWSEQHAVRSLGYVCNQLDMKLDLGETGKSNSKSVVDGKVNNLVKGMLDDKIAETIKADTIFDEANDELLYLDVEVIALGILKGICKRIGMA